MKPLEKDIKKTFELNKEIVAKRIKKFEQEKLVSNLQNQKENENNLAVLMKQSEDSLGTFVDATYSQEALEKKRVIENHIQKVAQDLKQEISESNKKIQAKTNDIQNISETEKDAIEKRGGDISILENKLKPEFNLLKSIRENVGTKFAKIAGTLGLITSMHTSLKAENITQGELQIDNVESSEEDEPLSFNEALEDPEYFLDSLDYYKKQVSPEVFLTTIKKICRENSKFIVLHVDELNKIKGLDLKSIIIEVSMDYEKPDAYDLMKSFVGHYKEVKKIPGLEAMDLRTFYTMLASTPELILEKIELVKQDVGNSDINISELIEEAVKKEPISFLSNFKKLKEFGANLDFEKLLLESAKNHEVFFLENLEQYSEVPGVQEKALWIIKNYPLEASTSFQWYKKYLKINNGFSSEILENMSLVTYNNNQRLLLLEKIINQGLSVAEADMITRDSEKLFDEMINIKTIPNHLADGSIERELNYISSRKIRTINDLHELPDNIRFQSVKNSSPAEMYTMMTYGEDEVFTSTFRKMFDQLLVKLDAEKIGGYELLNQVGNNKSRIFIKECAGYGKLDEFLATMTPEQQKEVLVNVIKDLEK